MSKRCFAAVAAGMVLFGLLACERADRRVEHLSAGMPKDSVLKVMQVEKPQRLDPYLYKGQYIEAMYFPRLGKTEPKDLESREMTPVVLINGKLVGWGWNYWDSVAAANFIEVAKKK